jgi:hypothetical protein
MKLEVSQAIEELGRKFPGCDLTFEDDGSGGARVLLDNVDLGDKLAPAQGWLGGHITGLYPYADIYPLFIGAEVKRANGHAFVAPITTGHMFRGRPALQISRRNNRMQPIGQPAYAKFLKVLDFLKGI